MGDVDETRNTNLLSQSYVEGVKRIAGKRQDDDEEFYLSQEVIDSRKRTWSWLFEKFSEVSDNVELNIKTLKPHESSDSHNSEYRVPVRRSKAQVQYWVNTGNPPCQLHEEAAEETDGTISISESEASELESLTSMSMLINKKQVTSTDQLVDVASSGSSVDTATYIKTNTNTTKRANGLSAEKDPRVTNFANLENNRVSRSNNVKMPKVLLSRLMESPKNAKILENNSVLHKNTTAVSTMDGECNRDGNGPSVEDLCRKSDKIKEILHLEQSKLSNLRESEVTQDSKESGIGSLLGKNIVGDKKTEEIITSDSQNEIISQSEVSHPRLRKLYTKNNSFFDLYAPSTQTICRKRHSRYSIHPALSNDSTVENKKRKFRPSLLTLPGNLKARKSRIYSANTSRTTNKPRRKSLLSRTKNIKNLKKLSGRNVSQIKEATVVMAEKIDDVQISPGKEVTANVEKTLTSSIVSTKRRKTPKLSSLAESSSSLSSADISKIINEKFNRDSRTPVIDSAKKKRFKPLNNAEIQSPRDRDCRENFIEPIPGDSQGSVFSPGKDASPETRETRMKNMLYAKKNLFATDFRSIESNSSPLVLSTSREDSVDKASPTLVYSFRKKTIVASDCSQKKLRKTATDISAKISACGQSNPVVILHDFQSLKKCCGKLDREAREKWMAKKNVNKESHDKKALRIEKSSELLDRKIPTQKSEVEKEMASFKSGEKIPPRKFITNVSCSSDEFPPSLKYAKTAVTVTFPSKNCGQKESLFDLKSTDGENFLKKLLNKSRSRSSKRRGEKKLADENIADSVGNNKSVEDGGATRHSKFNFTEYKIVSSSSENEETVMNKHSHPTELRKSRRKFSKRNEGKDSPDSGLMMRFTPDGWSDKSAGLQHQDEKLEKQSLGVNKRLETSKGKQPLDLRGGFLAAQSDEVNNGPRSHRKSRMKVRKKEDDDDDDVERVVSDDKKTDKTRKIIEVENCAREGISERLKTPADCISNRLSKCGKGVSTKKTTDDDSKEINSTEDRNRRDVRLTRKSGESPRKKKRKSSRKIVADSSESDEKPEVEPELSNYKDTKQTSRKIAGRKALIDSDRLTIFCEESSDTNDAMIFSSQNNAGSYSRIRGENSDDTSLTIKSYKHPVSPTFTKRGKTVEINNVDNNYMKEKSTIIFRTKEYWESDSDNS